MLSGIGIWQLLIVLAIVLLLFGTKRLKGLGGDLGGALKGFKKAMSDEKTDDADVKAVGIDDTKVAPTNESATETAQTEKKQ
ncbi:MAG: twin-arginine translocase TatA/TatE family subunit [Marinagarivorans sp.]|nr:twin-arginine translocase TatA/TatE family subunit [Marinagarivorans sp.]